MCKIIPGIAYITTPEINAERENCVPSNPQQIAVASARTTLPISIDIASDT